MLKASRATVFIWVVLFAYIFAALIYPSCFLLRRAFLVEGEFSTASFASVFSDRVAYTAMIQSIALGISAACFSWVFAVPATLITERFSFRGRSIIEGLILAPLFLPPFVGVIGLKNLINQLVDPQSDYNLLVIGIVQALHLYPLVYLSLRSGIVRIPAGLHEASYLNGASFWRTLWKIDYGLVRGLMVGSMMLVFVASITDVGTPLLFERRDLVASQVFQTLIDNPRQGAGYALCVIVLAISVVAFFFVHFFEKRFPSAVDARIAQIRVPKQKLKGALSFFIASWVFIVAFAGVAPHLSVLTLAVSRFWFLTPLPTEVTGVHFLEVFSHPLTSGSLLYSVVLSIAASIICLVAGIVIGWRSVRSRHPIDKIFESLSMLPLAVPGIAVAFGMVIGYAGTWIDNRRNPTFLLILAYSIRKLPLMVRAIKAAILQYPVGLEEAALLTGAPMFTVIRRIVVPLIKPACIAGVVVSFFGALLEVSDSLLLPLEEKFFPIAKALYALQGRPDGGPLAAAYAILLMLFVLGGFFVTASLLKKKVGELLRGN